IVILRHGREGRSVRMSTVQNFPHPAYEETECKWLLQKYCPWLQYPVISNRMVGVARHINNLHFGSQSSQFVSQLTSAHKWHHDVGQQQMNRAFVTDGHSECLSTMIGFQYRVAIFLENGSGQITDCLFVLDQQDRLGPMREFY